MDSFLYPVDTLTFLQNKILCMDMETTNPDYMEGIDIDMDMEEEVLEEGYVVSNGWIQFQ